MNMRLFIAIQFTPELPDALTDFQNELKSMGVTGNYSKQENLHVTLAFIGEYGNPEDVLDAMEDVGFRPIQITLSGVGSFGDLFWAGLTENRQLDGYVRRLRRKLSEAQIPYDKKKFNPHITLIRKYSYRGGREIPVSDPPKGTMIAERVSLMRSERGKNGMIYTEVGSIGI